MQKAKHFVFAAHRRHGGQVLVLRDPNDLLRNVFGAHAVCFVAFHNGNTACDRAAVNVVAGKIFLARGCKARFYVAQTDGASGNAKRFQLV